MAFRPIVTFTAAPESRPGQGIANSLDALHRKLDALLAQVGPPQRFLTIDHAGRYCDLSADSVRRLIEAGKLTAHRPVRGRILVDRQQLDAVILASTTPPRAGRGRRADTDVVEFF